jgi:hypothetical protein
LEYHFRPEELLQRHSYLTYSSLLISPHQILNFNPEKMVIEIILQENKYKYNTQVVLFIWNNK